MAGSTLKSVHDIFQSMEYGPAATPSYAIAQVKLSTQLKLIKKREIRRLSFAQNFIFYCALANISLLDSSQQLA